MTHSPATEWSRAFLGELYAWGVRDVVLSPGSRSQALALAACVTTSGSAPGHYLPAIMEAHHSGIPLILVSADRPEELRGVGANQTTTQEGLFGVFAETISVPTPDKVDEKSVAGLAADVMQASHGNKHPVHINVGLREPLSSSVEAPLQIPEPKVLEERSGTGNTEALDPAPGTLVIAGHGAGPGAEAVVLRRRAEALARDIGAPLIAEAVSGARFGPNLVLDYRSALRDHVSDITRVITWGRPTLSREVWAALSDATLEHFVVTSSAAEVPNPSGKAVVVDGIAVATPATKAETSQWVKPWVMAGRERHAALLSEIVPDAPELSSLEASDPASRSEFANEQMGVLRRPVTREALAVALWEATWPHDRLVLGASRMVRVVDGVAGPKNITVHSSRGLSGIDGTVSYARGIASSAAHHGVTGATRVLLGDLALLHDAGSLMREPGREEVGRVHLFVANDGGGTIFDALEVASTAPAEDVTRVLYTPHDVKLESLADAYGWTYRAVSTMGELTEALSSGDSHLVVDIALPRY